MQAHITPPRSEPLEYTYRADRHLRVSSYVPIRKPGSRVAHFIEKWNAYPREGYVLILCAFNGGYLLTINSTSYPLEHPPYIDRLTDSELLEATALFTQVEVRNEFGEIINTP